MRTYKDRTSYQLYLIYVVKIASLNREKLDLTFYSSYSYLKNSLLRTIQPAFLLLQIYTYFKKNEGKEPVICRWETIAQ
jgi:hypothetical protein